jgi:hypothetical protein
MRLALLTVSLSMIAACGFDREIPPEAYAVDEPPPPDEPESPNTITAPASDENLGAVCARDHECGGDLICFGARCTPTCVADPSTCGPGSCDQATERCVGALAVGQACLENAECESDICAIYIYNGERRDYCTDDCTVDQDCAPDLVCDAFTNMCEPRL